MSLTLLVALVSLATWALLTFGVGPHTGAIHLLLAVGATLLVRWWALRVRCCNNLSSAVLSNHHICPPSGSWGRPVLPWLILCHLTSCSGVAGGPLTRFR